MTGAKAAQVRPRRSSAERVDFATLIAREEIEDGEAADVDPDFFPQEISEENFPSEVKNLTPYQKKLLEKAKEIGKFEAIHK